MCSPTDIAHFSFPRHALASLFLTPFSFTYATCKMCPRNAAKCFIILSRWYKENSGEKKRKRKNPIYQRTKDKQEFGKGEEEEKGGRVTLRSIEQGNTIKIVRSPEAWRDANPVFHSSSPSLFFLRFRETSTRALRVAQKHPSLRRESHGLK